jgi:hypothetical protein
MKTSPNMQSAVAAKSKRDGSASTSRVCAVTAGFAAPPSAVWMLA